MTTDVALDIEHAYAAATPASAAWHQRAARSLPDGVSGAVRSFSPHPIHLRDGLGAEVVDLDGRTLIDCFLSGATALLGHAEPSVSAAITAASGRPSLLLNPTHTTETAELLRELVPSAERVRFVNSGTEAVMNALRIARAFTGRSKVIKFWGTYHGMDDQVLTGLDARRRVLGGGIPASLVADTVHADIDDLDAVRRTLADGDVAAVLLDASMHHSGLWAPSAEHLQELGTITRASGALLIADEVISGFRLAPGGGQEYFGLTPDLSVFGKAFAVGERLGAIVGRADVMAVTEVGPTRRGPFAFQSGTCNDSTISHAAAQAAMARYRDLGPDGYAALSTRAAQLAGGLRDAFTDHGIPCLANQLGPIVRLFLTDGPATAEHCTRLPSRPIDSFHLALLTEGILTLPGSNDFFLSFAHTDEHIDAIVAAAVRVLDQHDIGGLVESEVRR
jgi:glutamate-1-semialdehyde 2,1-aminomutase